MKAVDRQLRIFAERLIAHETAVRKMAQTGSPAAFAALDKLGPEMARLMGRGGVRALLSRALALANEDVRWLRAVHVKADGALEGLEGLRAQLTPAEFAEGEIVLLAQTLGLLVTLIGRGLTSRVVGEIWPDLPVEDFLFGNGKTHEKKK